MTAKSHLAPHEWDAYGKPPKPGATYDPGEVAAGIAWSCAEGHADCETPLECITTLEGDAYDLDGEADSLREEAEDKEKEAKALWDRAQAIQEMLNQRPWTAPPARGA